jgi:hypothetical protein
MDSNTAVAAGETVGYQLSVDDYVRGGQLSFIKHFKRPSKAWFQLIASCAVVVGILYVNRGAAQFNPLSALALIAVIFGMRLLLPYFLTVPASFRKTYAQNKRFQMPLGIAWTDKDVTFSSENSFAKVEWADLHDFAENDRVMLFYTARHLMQILPKHALSDAQIEELSFLGAEVQTR